VKGASRAPWGGLQGYLADPDGFHWEVAHNPGLHVHADGRVEFVDAAQGLTVRTATPRDAVAVARIHAAGIATRTATFEPEAPTPAEVLHRIVVSTAPYAFVVAELEGRVVGWAATSPHSPRQCFSGIAEIAVYVDAAAQGRGVGAQLLAELRERSEAAGLHKLLGRVLPGNLAAASLFAGHGFTDAGVLRRHARVDGEWRDCVLVEALLGDAAQPLPREDAG
jgi:phosphinothricin acetyltransferase